MELKVICAWCHKDLGTKACKHLDEGLPRISHSICPECYVKLFDDLSRGQKSNNDDDQQTQIERRN